MFIISTKCVGHVALIGKMGSTIEAALAAITVGPNNTITLIDKMTKHTQ